MKIRELIRRKILNLRSVERIIQSKAFEEAYNSATLMEQQEADNHVHNGDSVNLTNWIRKRRIKDVAVLSIRELKTLARHHHVSNYGRLPKASLLSEISYATAKTQA